MADIMKYADMEQFSKVFSLLTLCTDECLFIYDLIEDKYVISDTAEEIFQLEQSQFSNAAQVFQQLVYSEDFAILSESLDEIKAGNRTDHDLEYRWIGKDGQPVWISCRGQVLLNEQGQAHYLVGRVAEIEKRGKIDGVTGLYRENSLKLALAAYAMEQEVHGFLLQIGIDNFKDINEKYGLSFGNIILANTAKCMTRAVEDTGRVYRMHGDEMIILCTGYDLQDPDPAKTMYKKVRILVDQMILEEGYHIFHTISGGSVYFDQTTAGSEQLIQQTGFALHQAKIKGKNCCVQYTQDDYDRYVHQLDVQEKLRQDIENNFSGFQLYYQPIVDMKRKQVLGAEALLRWDSQYFGFLPPVQFIPQLEESGLIIPLGRWIVRTALTMCKRWQKMVPGFRISINLSFVQIKKSDVVKDILEITEELHVDPSNVMFEVTESGELESGNAFQILHSFKNHELNLAIDDFGTGYSNLRYVRDMTFDLVKIDQSFIRNIRTSQYDYLLVKQFTELAHALHLKVCYEGVETKEDLECVAQLEPDYIQGYYFAKPVPADRFEEDFLNRDIMV